MTDETFRRRLLAHLTRRVHDVDWPTRCTAGFGVALIAVVDAIRQGERPVEALREFVSQWIS